MIIRNPGRKESVYETSLVVEMRKQGIKTEQQKEILVKYDEIEVGKHWLDLLVEDEIVVDLKTIKSFDDITSRLSAHSCVLPAKSTACF